MNDDFDINSVVAKVIDSQAENLFDAVKSTGKNITQSFRLSLAASFKTYVNGIAERHSKCRSFFYRTDPVMLYQFYVPIGVEMRNRKLKSTTSSALFQTPHVIIQGTGGSGKSVLSRHLLLDILRTGARIPILIELRSLNQNPQSVLDLVSESLSLCGLRIGKDVIEDGLRKGFFALLFDGFDELNAELRSEVADEIRQLATKGKKSWMLVTSRPDSIFGSWAEFVIYKASPLSLDQAVALVDKVPLDEELKIRFRKDLQDRLFAKHRSFLSNPLLLSIMLLTYQDAADIPNKVSVFYSQAFEALFQRHDAWKGGYRRQRKSDLDIHDFAKLFSAFSILAYDKRKFTFSSSEAVSMMKRAIELASVKAKAELFIEDCIQAVCLLVEDGLMVSYAHRSFQEFFAAKFISEASTVLKQKLLGRVGGNLGVDSVIRLLHELQPEFVQAEFILPGLRAMFKALGIKSAKITRTAHLRFLRGEFECFRVTRDNEILGSNSGEREVKYLRLLWFMAEECAPMLGVSSLKRNDEVSKNFCASYCSGHSGEVEVKSSKLTVNHSLVRHLYDNGVGFGVAILSMAWTMMIKLEERSQDAEQSIEQILSI